MLRMLSGAIPSTWALAFSFFSFLLQSLYGSDTVLTQSSLGGRRPISPSPPLNYADTNLEMLTDVVWQPVRQVLPRLLVL